MNTWQQFLLEHSARAGTLPAAGQPFVAPLNGLGLLSVTGEEAARFLHGQLTNDVEHLGQTEVRLAGYCTAKGRLLATMLMWRESDAILLALPREILPAIQKRLQMFVLRAKVKIADVSDSLAVIGLTGETTTDVLAEHVTPLPDNPYEKITLPQTGTLIRLADAAGMPRYQWITSIDQAIAAWPRLTQALQAAGEAAWRLSDIQAGVPQVVQATQEQFVPQMINYEVIGGVNFKKGCYPGQEIVARSQYLGKLKRRMMRADVESDTARAGMEIFSSADPAQPCGMVVNAEAVAAHQHALLAELKTAALEEGSLHLGAADGPALRITSLPYALPEDTA